MTTNTQRYLIDYYANGALLFQDEAAQLPPVIGQGVEYGGTFYRIVDVWTVHEKRNPVTHGTAVFLEETPVPDVFHEIGGDFYR